MRDNDGRAKLHADIAHPIHSMAREKIQGAVIKSYLEEREKAKMPGYVCTYDEYDYDTDDVPVSYGTMVSEMNKAVKPHGAHPAPKGTHFNSDMPTKTTAKGTEDFGAGLV
jgi:stage V sporulation protein G